MKSNELRIGNLIEVNTSYYTDDGIKVEEEPESLTEEGQKKNIELG